jgi:hypothetical protein
MLHTDHLKGTLLNRLFGTNFDVMDETQRKQTTKGGLSLYERYTAIYDFHIRDMDVSSKGR